MATPEYTEHKKPTEHDESNARKKLYDALPDFWKGYVGVVDGRDDPNYGKHRVSASERTEEYVDFLMEEYRRQQEEFAKYLREKEQKAE